MKVNLTTLWMLLVLVACNIHTSPDPIFVSEWAIAQEKLIKEKWESEFDVHRVPPSKFKFVGVDGEFTCGKILGNGCFHAGTRTIEYNIHIPSVIRHEAGHAILHFLANKYWLCYEHGEKCETAHGDYNRCKACPTCKGG